MNEENNITPQELVEIINNTDKKYTHAEKDYILIIRADQNRPCTLYLFDCCEAIWTKILDLQFFISLKKELKLASPVKIFAAHFVSSLETSSTIQKVRTNIKISVQLQIGEGLVMTCSILAENRVHFNNPDEFKKMLSKFTINLWAVKSAQLKKEKDLHEKQKEQQKKDNEAEKQLERANSLFASKSKFKMIIRKRNLLNPQKKKRSALGAKFSKNPQQIYEEVVYEEQEFTD